MRIIENKRIEDIFNHLETGNALLCDWKFENTKLITMYGWSTYFFQVQIYNDVHYNVLAYEMSVQYEDNKRFFSG